MIHSQEWGLCGEEVNWKLAYLETDSQLNLMATATYHKALFDLFYITLRKENVFFVF